jgi:hypothetical protein
MWPLIWQILVQSCIEKYILLISFQTNVGSFAHTILPYKRRKEWGPILDLCSQLPYSTNVPPTFNKHSTTINRNNTDTEDTPKRQVTNMDCYSSEEVSWPLLVIWWCAVKCRVLLALSRASHFENYLGKTCGWLYQLAHCWTIKQGFDVVEGKRNLLVIGKQPDGLCP